MSTILNIVLSSVSGAIIGSLFYGLFFGFVIFILNKVDKSGAWIGVFQNPVFLASIFGGIGGGVLGFFTGLIIGWVEVNSLLKGAMVGFAVTELMVIIFFVVFSFIDFSHSSNFSRLSDSIISSFFLFILLSLFLLIPSVIIGSGIVKLNNLIRPMLNF